MVSIWASAFAQQVHDRLEDTRAINAQREMANNVYNGQLVDLLDGQYKSNKKFYETEMTRKTSRRKPHMQDVNNALSALIELRVAQPSTSAQISAGGATSQQMSREDIEESIDMDQLYNVVVDMKEQNPSRRYTSQDWAISLGSVYKTNPDIFKKDPSKAEMALASTKEDPVAIKNTQTLINNQAQDTPTDNDSFLRTAATWLTPFYAALTNEPNNKMTDDNVRDLMRKRYGDNYDKMSKYREEYVPGRGTQHRVDPDIVRDLHDEMTKNYRRRAEGDRAEQIGLDAASRYQADRNIRGGQTFSVTTAVENALEKNIIDKFNLATENIGVSELSPPNQNGIRHRIFSATRIGSAAEITALMNILQADLTVNLTDDILKESENFNNNDTSVPLKISRQINDSSRSLSVIREVNKIIELRGTEVRGLSKVEQLKILKEVMKEKGYTLPKKDNPLEKPGNPNPRVPTGVIVGNVETSYRGLQPTRGEAVKIELDTNDNVGYYDLDNSNKKTWHLLPSSMKEYVGETGKFSLVDEKLWRWNSVGAAN